MPGLMISIHPQDELLRLTGSAGTAGPPNGVSYGPTPFEDISASGNGTARNYGANRTFIVRPVVAGIVVGTLPTLDLRLEASADGVSGFVTVLTMTQITASNNQGVTSPTGGTGALPPTMPPQYSVTLPPGRPWVRVVKTIGGTAGPSFPKTAVLTECQPGF